MEFFYLEIKNLMRRKIKYKYVNRAIYGSLVVICIVFCIAVVSVFMVTGFTKNYIYGEYLKVSQPYTYSVNVDINDNLNGPVNLILPITTSVYENKENYIKLKAVESIMVIAPEDGIVTNLGLGLNNIKFIEVTHGNNIISVIENVDIIGVKLNQAVAKGSNLATVKVGGEVIYKISVKGEFIKSLKIIKNEIEWEK